MIEDTENNILDHVVSPSMSSQKLSVLLVSQASSLIMGHLTPVLPGMKHLMERIGDTDILSSSVVCKNRDS